MFLPQAFGVLRLPAVIVDIGEPSATTLFRSRLPADSDLAARADNTDSFGVLTCGGDAGTFKYDSDRQEDRTIRVYCRLLTALREDPDVTPSDVQALFLDQLGLSLGDEMIEYTVRRFLEGGAAAVPVSPVHCAAPADDPVRRFAEIAGMLGDGSAVPAEITEPVIH